MDEATRGARPCHTEIRHLLEGFLGRVRSAATYMGHVCASGLGGKLLRCVWNTSGTGLERGLERLREWLALGHASKQHVNMVVSTM